MMKIKLKPNQQLFFTSDTHYNHKNICRGVTNWIDADNLTRDFKTLDEMNDRIVSGINDLVGPDDILFHLGDWSFGGFESIYKFRDRINCNNIHLVFGNHDHHIERDKDGIRHIFESVNQYLELEVNKQYNYILMHYPIMSWNNMNDGTIHLHGHVHLPPSRILGKGKMMDVGMDGNQLSPVSMDAINTIMSSQSISSGFEFDHHVKRVE